MARTQRRRLASALNKEKEMKYLKMLGLAAVAAMALMAVVGAGTASATTLATKGVAVNASETIEATLATGTSAILKDKNGTTNDTCTTSTVEGATVSPYTGATVGGPLNTLDFGGCSHTTDVIKPGVLSIAWTSGLNGTVTSKEAEVTVKSTVFGISAVCKTGSGVDVGTLTGVSSGNATMHINATTLDCGALGTSSWTGTYTITTPGLGVVN
jgi:hypothetical protein